MINKFGLSSLSIQKLKGVFEKYPQIKRVIIYGSRAKGNYKSGSDIDLTLMGEKITVTILLQIENDIDDLLLPYKVDLSIYDKIDSQDVRDHIDCVGKTFFNYQIEEQ